MKKNLLHIIILLFLFNGACAQVGMWTWMNGDSVPNSLGVFGTQGISGPLNHPPALYEAAEFTDLQGNFWLFGGAYSGLYYGDLWKYNPAINQWTWVKGTGITNTAGNYGIKGVAALSNLPGSLVCAASWVDLNGDFWMYGGIDGSSVSVKNALWKYNIATNTWTWMQGSTLSGQTTVYGTIGIPSINNTPGARCEVNATWIDNNNNLWLFGSIYNLNDLWKYDPVINQWTWMKGANFANQVGIYGTKGVPDPSNVPGGRAAYCHWKDSNGNFWFFGGLSNPTSFFNDMWMYNPSTNQWTWMSGTNNINDNGNYGTQFIASSFNVPPARFENRCCWKDINGNFWMYGGARGMSLQSCYADLWKFNPITLEWTFISGDTLPNQNGLYGTKGTPSIFNKPGGRAGTIGWYDSISNSLFLFGGYINNGTLSTVNDLWKYEINLINSVKQINNPQLPITVTPNPFNSTITVTFQQQKLTNPSLTIKNVLGQNVFRSICLSSDVYGYFEIDLSFLPKGVYFLEVTIGDSRCDRKIVKN